MTSEPVITRAYLFCSIPHPSMVEFGATLGVRGVIIDDEKFHASPEVVQSMCLAAEKWGLDALMQSVVAAKRCRSRGSERIPHVQTMPHATA